MGMNMSLNNKLADKTHNVVLWETSELDEEFVLGQAADWVRG